MEQQFRIFIENYAEIILAIVQRFDAGQKLSYIRGAITSKTYFHFHQFFVLVVLSVHKIVGAPFKIIKHTNSPKIFPSSIF